MSRVPRRPRPSGFLELPDQTLAGAGRVLTSARQALAAASSRLSAAVPLSLGTVIVRQPRYAAHAAILVVGGALAIGVALQPRPTPPATLELTALDQAVTADQASSGDVVAASDSAAPPAAPDADATATDTQPARDPAPKPQTHTVEEGETLRMLAAKYSVSPETIMAANGMTDPDLITVGEELTILPSSGVLYTLHKGEMLRQVADYFSVSLTDIVNANDLGPNPDLVAEGTQLFVPGADPALLAKPSAPVAQGDGVVTAAGSAPTALARPTAPSTRSYEVQDGDTLAGIAQVFGVDVATILSSNGISNPDSIKPGTELRILPIKGIEYVIDPGETLADIAWRYQVDLGLLLDYNDLDSADMIKTGGKLVIPGGKLRVDAPAAPAVASSGGSSSSGASSVSGSVRAPAAASAPVAQAPASQAAPKPAAAPAPPAPVAPVNASGGAAVVQFAMRYVGYPYVFGGTSPSGFDCSGFVYYVHNSTGNPIGRGMYQQLNGGPRIPIDQLRPGDTVFFANTYEPGLSHDGIYIGNGQFVHASDPSVGVVVSSMNTAYWSSRYVGASRLY